MYKNIILLITIFLFTLFFLSCLAHADTVGNVMPNYQGSLSGNDLVTSDVWSSGSITWNIQQNPDNSWHYEYNISVENKDISHVIIEVTPDADLSDFDFSDGDYGTIDIDNIGYFFNNGNSNPNIPNELYGIKFEFEGDGNNKNWTISFDSIRMPVWGDFYAKNGRSGGPGGGEWVTMWNDGFESEDNSHGHIMRPDGKETIVPEPGSMILVGISLAGVAVWRKRKE